MASPLDNPFFDENLSPGGPNPADYMPDKLFSEQNPTLQGPDPRDYLPQFQNPMESELPQPMSAQDKLDVKRNMMDAFAENLKSTAINPNAFGKLQPFGADMDHHQFERYYNHPDFADLGFSPFRDNESLYNENASFIDEIRRASGSWTTLAGLGFEDAMGFGARSDREMAREFEHAMAIGSSTKGGVGGFMTNLYLNSGYTFGIIGELALEELAIAGVTALSGGTAIEVTGPLAVGRAGRAGYKIWKGWKAGWKLIKRLDDLKDINKLRQSLGKGMASLGRGLNPFYETTQFFKNYNKLDNLGDWGKTVVGVGSAYRDIRNVRLAWGEAGLEAGMVDNQIREELAEEYRRQNNGGPLTEAQINEIDNTAKAAAATTHSWNTGIIYYSNRIVFDNFFRATSPLRRLGDDILTKNSAGRIVFNKKNVDEAFEVIGNNWQGFLKTAKNPRSWARVGSNYFKANLAEGIQETSQEIIAGTSRDYYMDRALGTATEGGAWSALGANMMKQVSPEGFEIFMSGFLMGGLVQPVMKAASYPSQIYSKFKDPSKYQEQQVQREEYLNNTANILNEMYNDPLKYMAPEMENMSNQKKYNEAMKKASAAGDAKSVNDLKDASVYDHVYTALRMGRMDTFVQRLEEMRSLNDEEIREVSGMEREDFLNTIDSTVNRAKAIESRFNMVEKKYANPFNPNAFRTGTPEHQTESFKYVGYQNAQKQLIFFQHSFDRTLSRMTSIMGEAKADSALKNTPMNEFNILLSQREMIEEIDQLENEIKAFEQATTPEGKKFSRDKQTRLKLLQSYSEALQTLMESEATDTAATTGIKSPNDIDGGVDNAKVKKVYKAFEKYLKHIAKVNEDYVFNDNVQNAFIKVLDYHILNDESLKLNDAVNELLDPSKFNRHAQRVTEFVMQQFANKMAHIENALKEWMKVKETNDLMQLLHDEGMFFDPSELNALINEGVLPKSFYYVNTKEEVLQNSADYAKALDIISNFVEGIMNIPIPEAKGTPYFAKHRNKINNDQRTFKDLAEQFGFDPKGDVSVVPLPQVLNAIIDSKYATRREKELARRLLEISEDTDTVEFRTGASRPGSAVPRESVSVGESTGAKVTIDARYMAHDYHYGPRSHPIEAVLLHEEVHRFTLNSLDFDEEYNAKITNLRELAQKYFDEKKQVGETAGLRERLTLPYYGLKNNAEFVAEAMSNDEFRVFLAEVPYEGEIGKSAWTEFVDSVINLLKKVFGRRVTNSVLNAAMDVITARIDLDYGISEEATGEIEGTPEQVKLTPATPLEEIVEQHPELARNLLQAYKDLNAQYEREGEDPIDQYWSEKSDEQLMADPRFKRYVSQGSLYRAVKDAFKKYNDQTGRTLEPEKVTVERPTRRQPVQEGTKVQIPMIITQQMRRDLRELGYDNEDIGKLTPATAWSIIDEGLTKEQREQMEIEAQRGPQEELTLQREILRAEIVDTISAAKNLRELEEAEEIVLGLLSSPAQVTATGFNSTDLQNMLDAKRRDLAFDFTFDDINIGEVMILNDNFNTKIKVESKDNNVLQTYAVNDITRRFNIRADQVMEKIKYRYSEALEEVGIEEEEMTPEEVNLSNESQENSKELMDRDTISRMINNARSDEDTGWLDGINEC